MKCIQCKQPVRWYQKWGWWNKGNKIHRECVQVRLNEPWKEEGA